MFGAVLDRNRSTIRLRCDVAVLIAVVAMSLTAAAVDQPPTAPPTVDGPATTTTPDAEPQPSILFSQAPVPPVSPYAGSLWERSVLLGDLGGLRDEWASNGVTFKLNTTQFYQGVTSGGINQEFRYSGRNDYFVNVDGEKAGLWKGAFFTLHGETRYGETINNDTGALMPANIGTLLPLPNGSVTSLTGVKMMQFLSEEFLVFGGKINTFDELNQPYSGGRGIDAFMNTGLTFPPTYIRTSPFSTLGAGFAVLQELQPVFSFMVLDTKDSPTTSGFDHFFTNGATMLSQVNIPVQWSGLPGHRGIGGSYSTGAYNDLQPTVYLDPNAGAVVTFGKTSGSWSVCCSADQALYVDPANSKRSWGLFTNVGLADNGPSPIRWAANVGVGGSSPLVTRPLDTFGIGYSYVGYSSPVKDLAPVFLPIRDDQAVELFYNIAITPCFRLTPDLQILVPARERTLPPGARDIDTAVAFGLRAKLDF